MCRWINFKLEQRFEVWALCELQPGGKNCPNPILAFIWKTTFEIKIYVYKKDLQT